MDARSESLPEQTSAASFSTPLGDAVDPARGFQQLHPRVPSRIYAPRLTRSQDVAFLGPGTPLTEGATSTRAYPSFRCRPRARVCALAPSRVEARTRGGALSFASRGSLVCAVLPAFVRAVVIALRTRLGAGRYETSGSARPPASVGLLCDQRPGALSRTHFPLSVCADAAWTGIS